MRLVCSRPHLTALLLSSATSSSIFLPSAAARTLPPAAFAVSTTSSRAFVGTSGNTFGVREYSTDHHRSAFSSCRTKTALHTKHTTAKKHQYFKMSSSSAVEKKPTRVACLQFPITSNKSQNFETAKRHITNAASTQGASLVILPEIWNSPYATAAFPEYAEVLPEVGATLPEAEGGEIGTSSQFLMKIAKEQQIWLVGGSIPEKTTDGKIYNTCLCVNPEGVIVAKHRKVHLFDIDVPGGITFKESDTLSAGDTFTAFDAGEPLGMIGVGICYDIRFPEYALLLCKKHKCNLLIYPGAFNMTTGPAHWELLQRARAVDNQCYVLTASPSRTEAPPKEEDSKYPHYTAWGHSTVVAPWGDVVATCDEGENVVIADLDMEKVKEMRMGIPTLEQKRTDMYSLSETEEKEGSNE